MCECVPSNVIQSFVSVTYMGTANCQDGVECVEGVGHECRKHIRTCNDHSWPAISTMLTYSSAFELNNS